MSGWCYYDGILLHGDIMETAIKDETALLIFGNRKEIAIVPTGIRYKTMSGETFLPFNKINQIIIKEGWRRADLLFEVNGRRVVEFSRLRIEEARIAMRAIQQGMGGEEISVSNNDIPPVRRGVFSKMFRALVYGVAFSALALLALIIVFIIVTPKA